MTTSHSQDVFNVLLLDMNSKVSLSGIVSCLGKSGPSGQFLCLLTLSYRVSLSPQLLCNPFIRAFANQAPTVAGCAKTFQKL